MQRAFLRLLIFQKRMFKKISFRLLLCAVPLLALGMRNLSARESGMLHIVLCRENPSDGLSGEIADRLLTEKSVIQYTLVQQPEEACALVESGRADAAWIFPDDMREKLDRFTGGEFREEGVIRVVEREDNVALRLAREKLFGTLYSHASYSLYQNFIRNELELEADEEILLKHYEDTAVGGNLFQLVFANGDGETSDHAQQNFLLTPVRGMLALLVLLCGLAADLYFLQDQGKGVLDVIPLQKRRKYLYLYQFTVMGAVAAAAMAAFCFSGVFTKWYGEIIWMAVYMVMCMGFCSLLQRLCGDLYRLAVLIPVLMLMCFILCPVFFSVRQLRAFQYLLPPYYYLNTIHNNGYLLKMLIYCVIAFGIDLVIDWLRRETFLFPVHRI